MTLQIPSCRSLLISLAFFLSVATCLPASADEQPASRGPSTTVRFADLDLNTDAGTHELLDRLSRAAGRVCEEYANSNWTLGYHQVYRSCLRSSVAAAVDKIHHERVSALSAAILNTP